MMGFVHHQRSTGAVGHQAMQWQLSHGSFEYILAAEFSTTEVKNAHSSVGQD